MFKLAKIFLFLFLLLVFFKPAAAQDGVSLYFFYGQGCPHCAKEEVFLEQLEQQYSNLKVHRFEVWQNRDNARLLSQVASELELNLSGVPVTIVGNQAQIGFLSAETTGEQIKLIIDRYQAGGVTDLVAPIIAGQSADKANQPEPAADQSPLAENITVPLIGEIKIKNLSLPVLTVVIGALDGFNPCAMWVLIFLISLLLGMQNRPRMWMLGVAFIIASGLVYFLFLSAWLNLFLFLGFIVWVRLAIGLVALLAGGYNLREYWKNPQAVCKVTGQEKRKKVFERLRQITQTKNFWLALSGVILLAVAVNLVELVCSAGLPAVYTQILSLSELAAWQYYGYLLLYIIIFMLDDILVFTIAMTTLKITGLSAKYSRWSYLIGGILMLLLGGLLIFKPGWLMFG